MDGQTDIPHFIDWICLNNHVSKIMSKMSFSDHYYLEEYTATEGFVTEKITLMKFSQKS